MPKSDELDLARAKTFAWRVVAPEDLLAVQPSHEAPPSAPSSWAPADPTLDIEESPPSVEIGENAAREAAAQRWQEEAYESCRLLAAGVERVYTIADAAQQAEAVTPLLHRAKALGISLAAMQHFPRESVRLSRLAVRLRERLSDEAMEAARSSCMWLDYTHPEVAELLVEVAEAADEDLASALDMALRSVTKIRGMREVSAKLGRILDEGSLSARLVALSFLDLGAEAPAVPALRRALRQPHLGLRWRALEILAERFPEDVTDEDLAFLLEDAFDHGLPEHVRSDEVRRAVWCYPEDLRRLVARKPPPGGEVALRAIIDTDTASPAAARRGLHAGWALATLAAGYPDHARAVIDRWMLDPEPEQRLAALEAVAHLPEAERAPLLVAAASDGAPEVADLARRLWLEAYASRCPADDLAGVGLSLRVGHDGGAPQPPAAPSEAFIARLIALRASSREARQALAEVLLGEAPSPDALALLVFAYDAGDLWVLSRRPALPEGRDGFCRALVTRFGAAGAMGLCALAHHRPQGRFGWLHVVHRLIQEPGAFPAGAFPAARAAAVRCIELSGDSVLEAWSILARVGAPAELYDRAWATVLDRETTTFVRSEATSVLASWPEGDRVEADAQGAMDRALAAGDLARFQHAAEVSLKRKLPAAFDQVTRLLADHAPRPAGDRAAILSLTECARSLRREKRLGDAWLADALAAPESMGFALAARMVFKGTLDYPGCPFVLEGDGERVVAALRRALVSSARGGEAAAEAATALLRLSALGPRSKKLPRILAAAPPVARAELTSELLMAHAPFDVIWPALSELLASEDLAVINAIEDSVSLLPWRRCRSEVTAILPRVADPVLRDTLELYLRLPSASASYWQDADER